MQEYVMKNVPISWPFINGNAYSGKKGYLLFKGQILNKTNAKTRPKNYILDKFKPIGLSLYSNIRLGG